MGQTFVGDTRVPVTVVKAGPCVVTQIKSVDNDGYWAVQLGFGEKRIKNVTKPLKGHLRGAAKGKKVPRFLREVRVKNKPDFKVGDIINASDVFKSGDTVSVTGTSKGKGFAGVVKRWSFAGGPRTHGQSDRPRSPGSIGQGTDPGRIWKGKKMAGRMGGKTITVSNLQIVSVDEKNAKIVISGPTPGIKEGFLIIKKLASGKLSDLEQAGVQPKIQEGERPEEEEKEGEAKGEEKEEKKEKIDKEEKVKEEKDE